MATANIRPTRSAHLLKHLDAGDFDMVVGSRFAPGGVRIAAHPNCAASAIGVVVDEPCVDAVA